MWKVNDPIYGTIFFNSTIANNVRKIIDSSPFQRLRTITHLGSAVYVYPTASHNRFSHCLGTAFLADKATDQLKIQGPQKNSIVLAALLHDIGQAPFSHCFLDGVNEALRISANEKITDKCLSARIFDSKLEALLSDKILARKISLILNGGGTSVETDIINSHLDMDRLDYLTRDNHFAGIPYGRVDFD